MKISAPCKEKRKLERIPVPYAGVTIHPDTMVMFGCPNWGMDWTEQLEGIL